MIKKSVNLPTKKVFKRGEKAWDGNNLTDAGLGDDINNPTPFGVNEAGGFAHFQNTNQPEISHD